MKPEQVMTGRYFMMGNEACAEGALAAGCEFCAGYPITPATEIANRLAERLPQAGGVFLQAGRRDRLDRGRHRRVLGRQESNDRDFRARHQPYE